MSTVNFSLFETRQLHSTSGHFCHNKPGIRVFESLLDNQRESAPSVVPEEPWFAHFLSCGADFLWRLRSVNLTVPQRVAPFYDRQTMTDWTTNLRHESDKLVYGSLHLLAPRWTVVKRAPCRWCTHRSQGHASSGTRTRRRIPGCTVQWSPRCGSLWAHNLWKGRTRQECHGPLISGSAQGFCPTTSWKKKLMDKRKQTARRGKERSRGDSNTQHERMKTTHEMMWNVRCARQTWAWALSHACACHQMWINEKMWRVKCAVHQPHIAGLRTRLSLSCFIVSVLASSIKPSSIITPAFANSSAFSLPSVTNLWNCVIFSCSSCGVPSHAPLPPRWSFLHSLLHRSLLSCFWLSSAAMPEFSHFSHSLLHCPPLHLEFFIAWGIGITCVPKCNDTVNLFLWSSW